MLYEDEGMGTDDDDNYYGAKTRSQTPQLRLKTQDEESSTSSLDEGNPDFSKAADWVGGFVRRLLREFRNLLCIYPLCNSDAKDL